MPVVPPVIMVLADQNDLREIELCNELRKIKVASVRHAEERTGQHPVTDEQK